MTEYSRSFLFAFSSLMAKLSVEEIISIRKTSLSRRTQAPTLIYADLDRSSRAFLSHFTFASAFERLIFLAYVRTENRASEGENTKKN